MEKIFASPKKIPAHFLKKSGVESFDLWFDALHKRDESDSWLDILKLSSSDGSVAGMPNFIRFSNRIFQDDKEGTSSDKGAMFQTNNGTVVIVRPHFDAQQKFSRVGNHRDYPLKDVVLAIEQNMPSRGEHNSFVSAGKKNKEGEGNVDATLSYTIQKVTERATGSGLLNRKISGLLTEVYDDKELKDFAKEFIQICKDEFQIELNCGIGTAQTSRDAVSLATKSLDTIREIRDSGKEKPEIYELN